MYFELRFYAIELQSKETQKLLITYETTKYFAMDTAFTLLFS